jgi:hypothetical protein
MKYKYLYQNILLFFTKISNYKSWKIFKIIFAINLLFLVIFYNPPVIAQVSYDRRSSSDATQLSEAVRNANLIQEPSAYQNNAITSDDGIDYIRFMQNFKIYTNYLPPKITVVRPANYHYLDPCTDTNRLEDVGESCMYKIAENCPPSNAGAGVNCINYSTSFLKPSTRYLSSSGSTKNLEPKLCETGVTHGNGCIGSLPYCSEVTNPILGLTCALPPCSFVPNTFFRRPGVNCLANCLDNTKDQIINDHHFIEGVNCLTPCDSFSSGDEANIKNYNNGKCVLTFLSYVIPFCNKTRKDNIASYNLVSSSYASLFPRKMCINLEDLPICTGTDQPSNIDFTRNCAKACPNTNDENHGKNCIDKFISKYCHHKYSNDSEVPKCNKLDCSQLTPDELNNPDIQNVVEFTIVSSPNYLKSDENFCNTVPYDNFTYEQLKSITGGSNKYLRAYTLARQPCVPYDGTSFNMSVLSSQFFTKATNIKILQEINAQCTQALTSASCPANLYSNESQTPKLFDTSITCSGSNRIEAIPCATYTSNQNKPNDCNSSSPHSKNNCTKDGLNNTPTCCPVGNENCFKFDIDCNLQSNNAYSVCQNVQLQPEDIEDHQLSWFFRPSILPDAIREVTVAGGEKKYETWPISGHAFDDNPPATNLNGELRLYRSDIAGRGWPNFFGIYAGTTSPGTWSDGLKTNFYGTGLGFLCGVNGAVNQPPSSEGAYYKGEIQTTYSQNFLEHRATICLRKESPVGLGGTSCGNRKCRVYLDLGTAGASCGTDICRNVSIKTSTTNTVNEPCNSDDYHFKMGVPALASAFQQNVGGMVVAAGFTSIGTGAQAEDRAVYNTKPCLSNFEVTRGEMSKNIRVRLFKPDPTTNYICAVIEMRNVNTRNNDVFFKGHEFFLVPTNERHATSQKRYYKKLCFSGKFNVENGLCENGINYNDDSASLYLWRAARIVKYVDLPPTIRCGDNLDRDCGDSNSTNDNLSYDQGKGYFTLKHYGYEYTDKPNDTRGPIGEVSNKITDDPIKYHIGRTDYIKRVLLEKSDCIKHQLRLSTPINYAIANNRNSQRLFLPTIKIDRLCSGRETSPDECNDSTKTDFFKPAMLVLWGNKNQSDTPSTNLSSNYHYKKISINDVNNPESEKFKLIPNVPGFSDNLSQEVVIKKFENDSGPLVCLFKRNSSSTNSAIYVDDFIKCLPREFNRNGIVQSSDNINFNNKSILFEKINNFMALLKNTNKKPVLICQSPIISKELFGKKIQLHAGLNYINFNTISSTDVPNYEKIKTPIFNFNTPNVRSYTFNFSDVVNYNNLNNLISCESTNLKQGYTVCLKRDKCSILNLECVNNQQLYIDEIFKTPQTQNIVNLNRYISFQKFCLETLLPECNKIKGLPRSPTNTILNPSAVDGFNQPAVGNYYGWFNEVCIDKGVELLDNPAIRKYVIQNNPVNSLGQVEDSMMGKCIRNDDGVNCRLYDTIPVAGENQKARLATPHELNLCYEYTRYKRSCRPIMYMTNPIASDKYFTSDLIQVHQTHLARAEGITKSDGTKFYAEFDISFPGNTIYGQCNGFWRQNQGAKPYATCDANGNLIRFVNSCIRYACPPKEPASTGADQKGEYKNDYDSIPTNYLSQLGKFHGYAKWSALVSSDHKQNVEASGDSCIPGYRKVNSIVTYRQNYASINPDIDLNSAFYQSLNDANKLSFNSIYNNISGYNGGTSPSRYCNQLGEWENVVNPCQRITCPPLDFPRPADENSFNLNSYTITHPGNLIRIENSPYDNLDVNKVRFVLNSNINQSTIYLNPTNSDDFNNIPLRDTNGISNITNLIREVDYVFELISDPPPSNTKYWKKIPNDNDLKYKILWRKTGGAKFPQGYAHRSTNQMYKSKAEDTLDHSFIEGECQESLGFKHIEGNPKPMLFCNNDGNWKSLQNACMTDCSEVTEGMSVNDVHGFSLWERSTGSITRSLFVQAKSCSRGYIPYPYTPPYDEEGDKGDYGNNTPTDILSTDDDSDGSATTTDGSLYIADIPLNRAMPDKTYDLRIIMQGQTPGVSAEYGPIGDSVFELYNNSSIQLNASTNTVWSDIKFASFGTPDFSSRIDLRTNPSCHSPYSRLNVAKRCIGKRTCTLSLSDFSSYDVSLSCDINFGNGKNGAISTNRNFGSGGGGGGGNFLNSSQNGGIEGQIGLGGANYCDKYYHITENCVFSSADNKGLKVDLTQPLDILGINQFDGKNGYAIIKKYDNNTCSGSPTITTYNLPGLQIYTVSGSSSSEFCIEYELAGAGGGGGGAGINFGTDGGSGGKVTGKFNVKGGTSINLYIGQGGKAGKSRCVRENGASASLDHNFYDNFASKKIIKNNLAITNFASKNSTKNNLIKTGLVKIDLAQNNLAKNNIKNSDFVKNKSINKNHTQFNQFKSLTKSFNHQPIFAKLTNENDNKKSIANLYNKISEVFISKGWGNNGWSNYVKCDNGLYHNESVKVNDCPGYDKGSSWKTCNCPWPTQDPYAYLYHDDMHSSIIGNGNRSGYGYFDVENDVMSSFSLGPYTQILLGGGQSEDWFGPIVNNNSYQNNYYTEWVNNFDNCNYHNRGKDCNDDVNDIVIYLYKVCNTYTDSNDCGCNAYRHHNNTNCVNNNCYSPDHFGIEPGIWMYYGSGSTNCTRANTTGIFHWQCNSNHTEINVSYNGCRCATGYRQSGNHCIPNTCTANARTGFTATTYNYGTTTLNCDRGFTGTVTVPSCTVNGANNNPTSSNCTRFSCTTTATTGYTSKTYQFSGNNQTFNCDSGYHGTITFPDCSTNLATNAHITNGNNCKIKCGISSSTYNSSYGFTVNSGDYAFDNGSIPSKTYTCSTSAPYSGGTASFLCNSTGTLIFDTPCNCATNYVHNLYGDQKKCVRKCTITPADATYWGIATSGASTIFATNDYILNGSNNIYPNSSTSKGASYNCASTPANPAYNGGTITLSCGTDGRLSIGSGTGCTCASGYRKRADNSCEINLCTSMVAGSGVSSLTGIDFATLSSDNKQGAKTANCNVSTFSGTFNYVCGFNGVMTVTQNNCNCAEGYNFNSDTRVCETITCSAPETNGYVAKTNLPFTLGSTKGKIFCQKTGYHGFAEYTCKNGTGTTGTFTPITPPNNCQQILCIVPPGSNLSVADSSEQAYGSILGCANGYRQTSQVFAPYITCSATFDPSTNIASTPTNNIINSGCTLVTCLVAGTQSRYVNYSSSTVNVADCSLLNPSWFGAGSYTCNNSGTFRWENQCRTVTCQMPPCSSACISPNCHCPRSSALQNTTSDGQFLYNMSIPTILSCKRGYESANPPAYTCTLSSNNPLLTLTGNPCTRIQCRANNSLNSIIDNTLVDETNGEFVNTSCLAGFYSTPSYPPSYNCSIAKSFSSLNPCQPIKCQILASTPLSFGMMRSTEFDYRLSWNNGVSDSTPCNATGYIGDITYSCGGTTNPGTLSISANTCQQSICIREHGGKNLATFDRMMLNSLENNNGIGGGKNADETPTTHAFNFLKGGNGGNSSIDFTSGAGGGGGQASMIAINNKIIAIAGGGGGGAGGGDSINNNSSLQIINNLKLLSNVFGNYLYLKISNLGINFTEEGTAGIFSARNNSNSIEITAPFSKIINQIEFVTLGNPVLTDALLSSYDLKHGTCNANIDSDRDLNSCLAETTCSITGLDSKRGTCSANDMGLVASYTYTEPKLKFQDEDNGLLIKELSGTSFVSPVLENDKVYTFFKFNEESNYWIKSSYALNNIYLVKYPNRLDRFKIRFHRTNSSFEPKLKFEFGSSSTILPIKKADNKSLSIGYIKPVNTYILTHMGSYWEIKKYIPEDASILTPKELPSRTCSTVKLENNITRMWSGTSSKCINKCPGYQYDNRIGAGATSHLGSNGNNRKVKWPETNFNTRVILKINANSYGPDNTFEEYTGDITPNNFSGNEQFFIVSRYCNNDGSWSDPVYLCQVSGGSADNDLTVPPNSYNEYLTGNGFNTLYGSSVKYIEANNNLNTTGSSCLNGFKRDVTEGKIYDDSKIKSTSNYKCVRTSRDVNAKFFRILGTEQICIKYCSTAIIDEVKYSVNTNNPTFVKPNNAYDITCKTGFVSSNTDPTKSVHFCKTDSTWDVIAYQCRVGHECNLTSISGSPVAEAHGAWAINPDSTNKSDFFPLKSYLANLTVANLITNGTMKHGTEYTFPIDTGSPTYSKGRCAYVSYTDRYNTLHRYYVRKFLKSIQCYDGTYIPTWETESEQEARNACDGDYRDMWDQCEECHPSSAWIDYANGNGIRNANAYKNVETPLTREIPNTGGNFDTISSITYD